jgi:NADPH:quinone reductase-like Zn-dependent oxidoreductase
MTRLPGAFLEVLRRGGRHVIAEVIARIDLQSIDLRDLTLMGCTLQVDEVFSNLIPYIEAGEIRPHAAKVIPLKEIRRSRARSSSPFRKVHDENR